jgi:glycosyltransferase involved in cell wall biosynthesis
MKVLFASAHTLIDPSSGAARSVATFLGYLAAQGATCCSIGASVYDRPISAIPIDNVRLNGATQVPGGDKDLSIWRQDIAGVQHLILPATTTMRHLLTSMEELRLLKHIVAYFESQEPDAVITYGAGLLEMCILREARDRRIATFFYLANPTYRKPYMFRDVDQVLTDTEATRDLYARRFGLDGFAIGKYVAPLAVPRDSEPEFVTFINPTPEKGATLFWRIANMAAKSLPEARFLVVESRTTLQSVEQKLGLAFSSLNNVTRVGLQQDMGRIFGKTRVLIVPSLWHESGGRVAIEASSFGIPTVASRRGGLPEVLGNSGIVLDVDERLVADHNALPQENDALPWVEALRRLLTDAEFYEDRRQAALARWREHDPKLRIDKIVEKIESVIARVREPRGAAPMVSAG